MKSVRREKDDNRNWTATLIKMSFVIQFLTLFNLVKSQVVVSAIFSDNMVLQQKMSVPVWGSAKPKATVVVDFLNQQYRTYADGKGKWKLAISTKNYGGPYLLKITSDEDSVVFTNIMIGEVWVCSGQSNMEMPLIGWPVPAGSTLPSGVNEKYYSQIFNYEQEIKDANYPNIRLLQVSKKYSVKPQDTLFVEGKGWEACSPNNISNFSSTAYFFAKEVYRQTNIPIGLIHASVGGSAAELWTPKEMLEQLKGVEEGKAFGPYFNGMIHPIIPFAIRGVIWYQGEANVYQSHLYREIFTSLIQGWRNKWGQGNFPFYFVQLSSAESLNKSTVEMETLRSESLSRLREAQMKALSIPKTEMAVTIDLPVSDGHPRNKQDYGYRLAQIALAKIYGQRNEYTAPQYKSFRRKGNKIQLRFSGSSLGLKAKGSESLVGFYIAGVDSIFYPANACIKGRKVMVESSKISHPIAVRYAWGSSPSNNLCSKSGFPLSPFRTDGWPLEDTILYKK